MQPWKNIKKPEVVRVGWRTLAHKTFERPDGKIVEYTTMGAPLARHGAVIALTEDNQVVIAEQFRPGPEIIMQELPGGNIEEGENTQVAVMRELQEETGYASDTVTFLGTSCKDGYMNATWYFYLARNCKKVSDQALDDNEIINTRLISIEQLIHNAKTSAMSDALAVLMAYDHLQNIQKEKR